MKHEAVLFVAVPEAVRREGLMLPVMGPDRRPRPVPLHPKPGDLIYGIPYRARQVLYQRGLAVPVVFDDELKPRKPKPEMKRRLTRMQREERRERQRSLLSYIGGGKG